MKHTEEDIKQKVIMPFLKSLGFEDNELEFEKSFTLHLPRGIKKIDAKDRVEHHALVWIFLLKEMKKSL